MVTQTYGITIRGSLGLLNPPSETIEGDAEETIANVVDANATLTETLSIDVSQIQAFYLWADKDIDVTFNSAVPLASLVANEPFYWHTGMPGTNPLTVDITTLHFDNSANGTPANVKAEFLLNVGA